MGGIGEAWRGKAHPFSWKWGKQVVKKPVPSPVGSSGAGMS